MNENFFTANLMGGLGNQMFQIAHAYCQGLKHNVKTIFPTSASVPNQGRQTNNYFSNVFRKVNFGTVPTNTKLVYEKSWNDSEIIFDSSENIEFYGYYQGSKNFNGFDLEVKNLFEPSDEFLEKIFRKYPELSEENTVSIHVRRGDYLRFPNVHAVVDTSYINHCLSLIEGNKKIFFFSDDKDWVKNNFYLQNSIIVDKLEDYEELWMISLCKKNIMSCSSFSWWGSFLNKNQNKKVYVPNIWFGPEGPHPFDNIYEKDWKIINVKYKNGLLCF